MLKKAAVAGHICLDIIPGVDHHFDLVPGRLYEVGAPTIATGGAVSNTGLTMHILGVPVSLMGKVGTDNFGETILEVLKKRAPGLEKGMAVSPESPTSYSVVINIPGIDRIFLHCQGANATFGANDVNWDKVADAALLHFGYICFMSKMYGDNGAECAKMYKHAKELGVTTSLDPGMPDAQGPAGKADWLSILRNVLPFVDIFMPSADELLYMLDREHFGEGDNLTVQDMHRLGSQILDMGTAVAAIKMGTRGMYVKTAAPDRLAKMGAAAPNTDWANRELIFPVFTPDNFKGATGAGDSSIAGFLAALLRELPIENAGITAAAVGCCNVEAPDSLGGIKPWDTTINRINNGWNKRAITVDLPGWSLDNNSVWHGPDDNTPSA